MIRKAVEKLQEHSTDPLRELSLLGFDGEVFLFRNRNKAVQPWIADRLLSSWISGLWRARVTSLSSCARGKQPQAPTT